MEESHVDVLIITALQDELQAVLEYAPHGQAGGGWKRVHDQHRFLFHFREFSTRAGEPLRMAAASSGGMGERDTTIRAVTLIDELAPKYLVMCGICAGKPEDTFLGDIIVANKVYNYDHGKLIARRGKKPELLRDIETYRPPGQWLQEVENFKQSFQQRWEGIKSRPLSRQSQRHWLLHAQREHEDAAAPPPADLSARPVRCPDWTNILRELIKKGLLKESAGTLKLTRKGRGLLDRVSVYYPDGPQQDPAFRVHIGPIATGTVVRQDPGLFDQLKPLFRKTIGVEMEAAAIGAVAERLGQHSLIVKAVTDHADHEKDDVFRKFACEASAAFLIEFLLEQTWRSPPSAGQAQARKPLPKAGHLIGRKLEITQIIEAILDPARSRVVVLGRPGVGKSAVALKALHDARVEKHYGDRRFFAQLEGAVTAESISARIAQAIQRESVSDPKVVIQAELAKAPSLLVLDNIDTAWQDDRRATEELLQLLAGTAALSLIITLRGTESPDLDTISSVVRVPLLKPEESRELFFSIADDVRRDDSRLDGLLQDMGGVTLAVKLLAKQAQGVKLETTRRRWKTERTAMLQSEGSSLSLDTSIEFSLKSRALAGRGLRLLSILALLPAGIAEDDCDAILPDSDKAIASLQKAALVESDGSRWRLLGVIREHVRKRCPARPEDVEKTRDFYFALAKRLGPQLGKDSGSEALDQLTEEIDNIKDLLLAADGKKNATAIIDAALQVSEFIRFSGRGSDRPLEKALKLAKELGDTLKQAQCLLALGRFHLLRQPQYDQARQYLQEALILFKQAGDQHSEEDCLRELGHTAINEYELEQTDEEKLHQAEAYYKQALAIQQHFQDPIGEAYCLHGLARVLSFQNKLKEARGLFSKTLQMFREQEDRLGKAYSLRHLGTLDENDDSLSEATELFAKAGELRNLAHCRQSRGDLALKRNQLKEAEEFCTQALELFVKLQAHREAAWCRISLAQVLQARSSSEEARKLLGQACATAVDLGDKRCEARCRQLLTAWGVAPE